MAQERCYAIYVGFGNVCLWPFREAKGSARDAGKIARIGSEGHQEPTVMYVIAYAGTEQKDKAFNWLNKAAKVHSSVLMSLKVDPIYDPLRSDPRFEEILRRVGLAR